jgi:isoleucyl-tRNA synthetase
VATETKRAGRFAPVSTKPDLVEQEHRILELWKRERAFEKLGEKNRGKARFSFIDGPITANIAAMGVHHAWGRTYKDVFQRYKAMRGFDQRYQNGFDCQGLWVEVEVERDLGLNSKREIERYGLDRFADACIARVNESAAAITKQSIRLGQWMDWENSYYTYSNLNIAHIWHVLKLVHEKGWLYKGHRSMAWCARCGTALSEHEMKMEDAYREMTHLSLYVRFPLLDRKNESFLVWTTTPWTLPANVALAVQPALDYVRVRVGEEVVTLSRGTVASALEGGPPTELLETLQGAALLGLRYRGPFDHLPAAASAVPHHRVISWEDVGEAEGTGIVHIAPGAGTEDFELGKREKLPVLVPIDENAHFQEGHGFLDGKEARDVGAEIAEDLRARGLLYRTQLYKHRYPTCWRCREEIVFRVDDEWFISMEELRPKLKAAATKVNWVPESAGKRMQDWLTNMGDWNISRKRYWGLPLPFYTCSKCGHFFVLGSEEELRERARSGLEQLRELHRPWIDAVVMRCPKCDGDAERVKEVGDCWLDAGIVPFSTLDYMHDRATWQKWFPADFVTEMREQIRLWFYSQLFFSVVLTGRAPYENVLAYEKLLDEQGRAMHRSWGNVIVFPEAAERAGADVSRWLYGRQNIQENIFFGWTPLEDVARRLLTLWNTYAFFVLYANEDGFDPTEKAPAAAKRGPLDRWILSRLHGLIKEVTDDLERYDPQGPALAMERFWEELSNWYVRRSRRRFWKSSADEDKLAAEHTLYEVLTTFARLVAPYMPFLAETMYQNLVRGAVRGAAESVHHTDWPAYDAAFVDARLERAMSVVRRVASVGSAARHAANVKVRMPLQRLVAVLPDAEERALAEEYVDLIRDELNVKAVDFVDRADRYVDVLVKPDLKVLGPKLGKDLAKAQAALSQARLEPDGAVVAGEFRFTAGEVIVERKAKAGYALAGEPPYLALVDTRLTAELEAEGLARELVHAVQNLRREKGFEIADRIVLRYDGELEEVVDRYGDVIKSEVLALRIVRGTSDGSWKGKLNGVAAELEVERV